MTRSLVAVSADAQREQLLDALMVDANDYDVVFMESLTSAPARIRLVAPELVIVLIDVDDVVAYQLAGSLQIECERCGIAFVTCATTSGPCDLEGVVPVSRAEARRRVPMQMN